MDNARLSLEDRVEELAHEVRELKDQMAQMVRRVDSFQVVSNVSQPLASPASLQETPSSELSYWFGIPTLFSSISAVSFILVIALLLRTIVDQDFINQELGSIVGIAYATLLICLGYSRYSKSHPLAPTYVTCALLIMFSILLETHSRGFIPVWLAYAALGLTLIVSTVLGVRHSASIPLWVGVLGSSLVGIALEFPSPHYPQLMILLLVANASVYIGSKVSIWLGLRWTLFAISLFVWHLWTVQLRTLLLRGREVPEELALNWFLPLLGAFALVYA
ncbi:MAG: hypothetical protein KC964_12075, partial [Candidatus Omnitrophica bacterium]|nr:hypothetical protein [Candidatus Omnitrophota bacterium]